MMAAPAPERPALEPTRAAEPARSPVSPPAPERAASPVSAPLVPRDGLDEAAELFKTIFKGEIVP